MPRYAVLAVHGTQNKVWCRKLVLSTKCCNRSKNKQNVGYTPASATGCSDPSSHHPHKPSFGTALRIQPSLLGLHFDTTPLRCSGMGTFSFSFFFFFKPKRKTGHSYAMFHWAVITTFLFTGQTDPGHDFTHSPGMLQHPLPVHHPESSR